MLVSRELLVLSLGLSSRIKWQIIFVYGNKYCHQCAKLNANVFCEWTHTLAILVLSVINDGEESDYNMEMGINLGEYGASTFAVPTCSRMHLMFFPCIFLLSLLFEFRISMVNKVGNQGIRVLGS
jgi:succinate-acetate transporter protein